MLIDFGFINLILCSYITLVLTLELLYMHISLFFYRRHSRYECALTTQSCTFLVINFFVNAVEYLTPNWFPFLCGNYIYFCFINFLYSLVVSYYELGSFGGKEWK